MKILFKKFSLFLLATALCISLAGCSSKAKDYTGTQRGFGGDVSVTLSVKDDTINAVTINGEKETPNIGGKVLDDATESMKLLIGQSISDASSYEVNTVSGATVTSTALQGAYKKAIKAAKGDNTSKTPVKDVTAVYQAVGNSVVGPVSVEVSLVDNEIKAIKIVESSETDSHSANGTSHIQQTVIDNLIPRIIEHQSLSVDTIAGATNTSNAVKSAVAQAIDDNGGDSSEWYTEINKKDDTVVLEGYDVIVVGLGGSGSTAYMSAAENGATVFGIEVTGKIGGQSATTSGPMAINPTVKMQQENNGEKFLDEEALIADWLEYCLGDADPELVRWFVYNSGHTMDWLMNDYQFDFTKIAAFFHPKKWKVWASYAGDTTNYFTQAVNKAKAMNEKNDYKLELRADELILDKDGKILGVKATYYDGTIYEIYGDSVILATGGFISNSEMMEKYIGDTFNADTIGTQKGTGIQMGLNVNASTKNIDMPVMMHIAQVKNIIKSNELNPDQKAILTSLALAGNNMKVGTNGKRYMSESGNIAFDNWQGGAEFYAIYSQAQIDSFKNNGLPLVASTGFLNQGGKAIENTPVADMDKILEIGAQYGNVITANSIAELAQKLGVDEKTLQAEVDQYNQYAKGIETDPFGKDASLFSSLEDGPYVAIVGAGYAYGTCGGLGINTDMNVIDNDGNVIENLYAVGQDSMGVLFSNQVPYVTYGGAAQGWTITSGYQAGKQAAEKFK